MKTRQYISLLFIAFAIIFSSCGTHKKVARKSPLKHRSTNYLVEKLQASEFKCKWLSLKADVAFKSAKLSDSFKMHFRIRKDSAIWISTTYYSVEVARFLITPDTVKFMDRKANQFYVGNYDYLEKRFNLGVDFEALQAIVLGNSIEMNEIKKVHSYVSDRQYKLSSFGKRKMKKASAGEKQDKKPKAEMSYAFALSPETYKIVSTTVNDLNLNRTLSANYSSFQEEGAEKLARKIDFDIRSESSFTATMEYLKVTVDKPVKMSFNIPEKYERVN